ncbi:V-type proton ATPase subunit S1 [Leguminivora glycinivorella]|uniref:V-type proton ATPase subunit S1 n=1 Tax=Leguminivora glycinivorella TaxID=1035111 RepID=UPI00200C27EC|nr:V-type proton ATPase subunit S1 [Leguminivora glycinivorella]
MAFSLVFTLLALSAVSYATNVPVYLWGDLAKTSLKASPLYTVEPEEFSGILNEELSRDPFTVIFIEETLSVEDFSRKNAEGKTSFPYLRANIRNSAYLPSVENALGALNKLADPEKVNHVKLTENGLSAEIEPESGKFLFINLKDAKEGESRFDLLRRHNDFMEDMFSKLQERYETVVAIYTAHFPSWTVSHSRVRRQAANNETQSDSSTLMFDGLLLAYKSVRLIDDNAETVLTAITGSSVIDANATVPTQNSTLTSGENKIVLYFTQEPGYWILQKASWSNSTESKDLTPSQDLTVPFGFSYRCAQNVSFSHVNDSRHFTLTFTDLKIQPFFINNSTGLTFGDSLNCVGFFSAPIWASLFVTFILLFIMFFGIMMMMDIRTMDRFDDPKGKTITINAAE